MAKEISTTIHIHATAETVWKILTDFENYPSWNPFIVSLKGPAVKGKKITAQLQPPGAKGMTFKPTVLAFEIGKEFRWLGHLLFPGIFDGEHRFELTAHADGSTTFRQSEKFSGLLVPFLKKMLDKNTKAGFELMNLKLKEKAEKAGQQ